MQIDGFDICIGSKLYDLFLQQRVQVVKIRGSIVTVRYQNKNTINFIGDKLNGLKRLYWGNPVIIVPTPENEHTIEKLKQIAPIIDCSS